MPSFNKALVTGATSGLGKGLAQFLTEKGIQVIPTGSALHDLSSKKGRKELLQLISRELPDLIINNAGLGFYGPTIAIPIDEQLAMIEVNINALVEISVHSAQTLIKAKKTGTLLNISSAGAFFAYPTFNTYCASKRFVNQFSLALDTELHPQGVRVLCACPGQIATEFRARAGKGHPQTFDRRTISIETAVKHLWHQIETQKPLYIFDWKTHLLMRIGQMLPRMWIEKILMNGIKNRYPSFSQDTSPASDP